MRPRASILKFVPRGDWWSVHSRGGAHLGEIMWREPFRSYVFTPKQNGAVSFVAAALRDIAAFAQRETISRNRRIERTCPPERRA